MNMVWHYAPWAYLSAMVESGALRGSNTNAPNELPMLWFSANQSCEPTATKLVANNPNGTDLFALTFKQQSEILGCIRFGLVAGDIRLLNWKQACSAAGTPWKKRKAMETKGHRLGANPADWFATYENIALTELHFQVWSDEWCDASSPHDMAAIWAKRQARSAASPLYRA